MSQALRSIGAVLAGAVTGIILSVGSDAALHAIQVFPPWGEPVPDGPLLLATAYRTLYSVAGSYLTARLAPERPMWHALTLGVMGLMANTAGAILTWNGGSEYGAKWYPLALIATAMPCAWLGGRLQGFNRSATR